MPPDSRTLRARPSFTVAAAMTQPEEECRRRFRAAVDVIQSLPKNGSYRPSYEVMLRFYGLYKQAVFGPCRSSRPGFWDPVGRYKWDAWSRLGEMSGEDAMTEYVEEMKKVAQEVIDSVPVNKKTASLFHYFEPLYLVIHDMPRPPEALLSLRAGGGPRGGGRRAREGASGDGGGDEREGSAARQREAQMQRQIVSTLRQLREDMFGVMERLEAVERMAAAQARGLDRRSTGHPAAPSSETQQESRRWPLDASGRAALLLLLWPFAAHALASLLRRHRRESSLGPRGRR
ncbi:acyl-CoA-binding domain-containing protein 4 isoform X3 [Scleropages formosus]|uniref:acyl-CoA-binding domain-containing protein 4 isoform X3 n=1 Tax=Scleropages formosus TaxID=113540 RepID=UPI0010FA8237|nr:acyl-CoA-binding domain-containing protein 4 isoform X3 [Scleropages formosus]